MSRTPVAKKPPPAGKKKAPAKAPRTTTFATRKLPPASPTTPGGTRTSPRLRSQAWPTSPATPGESRTSPRRRSQALPTTRAQQSLSDTPSPRKGKKRGKRAGVKEQERKSRKLAFVDNVAKLPPKSEDTDNDEDNEPKSLKSPPIQNIDDDNDMDKKMPAMDKKMSAKDIRDDEGNVSNKNDEENDINNEDDEDVENNEDEKDDEDSEDKNEDNLDVSDNEDEEVDEENEEEDEDEKDDEDNEDKNEDNLDISDKEDEEDEEDEENEENDENGEDDEENEDDSKDKKLAPVSTSSTKDAKKVTQTQESHEDDEVTVGTTSKRTPASKTGKIVEFPKAEHQVPSTPDSEFHSDYMETFNFEEEPNNTYIFYRKYKQQSDIKYRPSENGKVRYNTFFGKFINAKTKQLKPIIGQQHNKTVYNIGESTLKVKDLLTMAPQTWLNDIVIEMCILQYAVQFATTTDGLFDAKLHQLLIETRQLVTNGPVVEYYNFDKAKGESLYRLQGRSILEFETIFIPTNPNKIHWNLYVIKPSKKQIVVLDSQGKPEPDKNLENDTYWLNIIFRWIYDYTKYFHQKDFTKLFQFERPNYGWKYYFDTKVPNQNDTYSCGHFMLGFYKHLLCYGNPQGLTSVQLVSYRKTIFMNLTPPTLIENLKKRANDLESIVVEKPTFFAKTYRKLPKLEPLTLRDKWNPALPSARSGMTPEMKKAQRLLHEQEREEREMQKEKDLREKEKQYKEECENEQKKEQDEKEFFEKYHMAMAKRRSTADSKVNRLLKNNPDLMKQLKARAKKAEPTNIKQDKEFEEELAAKFHDKKGVLAQEQQERFDRLEALRKKPKRHEDQIAYLQFRNGYSKKDPPTFDTPNYYKEDLFGNRQYQYNHFYGRTQSRTEILDQLSPAWVEDIFQLAFTQLVRKFPGCWFPVPIGKAGIVVMPPDNIRTNVKVCYQQKEEDFCITYSLASALHYIGEVNAAKIISLKASLWSQYPGDIIFEDLRNLLKELVPHIAECEVFNKRRKKKRSGQNRTRVMMLQDLLQPTPYITVVQPLGKDGSNNHAVCVVDNLVFDARLPTALTLAEETFNWVCGGEGIDKIGYAFRFSGAYKVKTPKQQREMILNHV